MRASSLTFILLLSAGLSSLPAQEREAPVRRDPTRPDTTVPGITPKSVADSVADSVPDSPSLNPQDSKPVRMKAAFLPGKTYRFVNTTNVRMQLPGRGIREIMIEHQARFDSKARPDQKQGASVMARTERLNVEIRSGEKKLTFDSLKEEDKQTRIGKHFRASLNRWVDLTLNKDSRVVQAEEGGRAGVATPLPGMPQFGPKELQQIVALIPQGIPEDEVRTGDEWVLKGSRSVGEVGELAFDITYRNVGPVVHEGNSCIQIDLNGRLSGDVALPSAQGRKMDFQGTSLRGKILYDPKEETIRLSEQSISMLMEIPGAPGEQAMQVPVEQQANLRLLHVIPSPVQ